jgi:hypothetical protein
MLTDTARFLQTDPDSLVSASLACPICLHVDSVEWDADVYGHDPVVECRCAGCEVDWRVYLAPHQALRFALAVPRHVPGDQAAVPVGRPRS